MKIVLTRALVLFAATFSTIQTAKSAAAPAVTNDDLRCEKMTGLSLVEFKSKLVENCDLNKPFSSSLSSVMNESTYFYCCQKKK
jgi:hypothetical protein